MLRVRLTASGIGLAATLSVLISSGCTPAPTEIVAVDSGVNVMPDMVVPITTAQLRFETSSREPLRSISASRPKASRALPVRSCARWPSERAACRT